MKNVCLLAFLLCFSIMSPAMQGLQPNGHLPQVPGTRPVLAPQAGLMLNAAPAQNSNTKTPMFIAAAVIVVSTFVMITGIGYLTWGVVDIEDSENETSGIAGITLGTLFIIFPASAIGGSVIYLFYKYR